MELGFLPGKLIEVEHGRFMVVVSLASSGKYSMNRKDFEECVTKLEV